MSGGIDVAKVNPRNLFYYLLLLINKVENKTSKPPNSFINHKKVPRTY